MPQIWRSRSGYKSIAVSFCDQLVCSRLLATQTRTSARNPVVLARGVRSELAEGGSSTSLRYVAAGSPRRSTGAFDRFLRPNSRVFSCPRVLLRGQLSGFSSQDSRTPPSAKIDVADFGKFVPAILTHTFDWSHHVVDRH